MQERDALPPATKQYMRLLPSANRQAGMCGSVPSSMRMLRKLRGTARN